MKTTRMKTRPRKLPLLRSYLCQMALAGGLACPSISTLARDNPAPLEVARQLNQAFIEVAETISPSVVVIEIAHSPEALEQDDENPLLEMIPKEMRKQWLDRFHKRHPSPRKGSDEPEHEPIYDGRGSGVVI